MSAWFTHEEEMQWLREEYLREGRRERDLEFVKILQDIESGKLSAGEVLRRMSKASPDGVDVNNIRLDPKGV